MSPNQEQLKHLKASLKALKEYSPNEELEAKLQAVIDETQKKVEAEQGQVDEAVIAFQARVRDLQDNAARIQLTEELKDKLVNVLVERQIENWDNGCMDRDEMEHIAHSGFTGISTMDSESLIREYTEWFTDGCGEDESEDEIVDELSKAAILTQVEETLQKPLTKSEIMKKFALENGIEFIELKIKE